MFLIIYVSIFHFNYSADGRKVLRSSIREFLCSEAMHYLNIPTVRAGTLITSDTYVDRDMYYDGNVMKERCSIVSRIAKNFYRFGSFEIFKPLLPGETSAVLIGMLFCPFIMDTLGC